jgi:membrane dipeptidase
LTLVPVFDGHNDVLLRLWIKAGGNPVSDFLNGDGMGHLDMPRMKAGGLRGGFFAIFAPSESDDLPDDDDVNPPLAGQISQPLALRKTISAVSHGARFGWPFQNLPQRVRYQTLLGQ